MAFLAPIVAAASSIAPVLTAVGTITSVIGAVGAANAQAAAGEYNARVAERDAYVAEQNSKAILDQTRIDVEERRRQNNRVQATMRAAYGASGTGLAGSALDVLYDTAMEQETDVRRIEYEGRVRAREGALQMLGLQESATLSRMEASNAKRAGYINAVGIAAGGAGRTLERTG